MKFISIGMNCEVSFQIERRFGKIESSLFSWAFICDDKKFLSALNNIDDVFENGVHFHKPTDDMFMDEKYEIAFHGRTSRSKIFDEDWNIIDKKLYDSSVEEIRSRVRHLKLKFKEQLNSTERSIFLRKLYLPEVNQINRYSQIEFVSSFIKDLENWFKLNSSNYMLVIIVDKMHMFPEIMSLQNEKLAIRKVDYFSDWGDTKNGADDFSYDSIFDEFEN